MAGRKCSVCSHPASAEITKLLVGGSSKSDISGRFGVTESSVQRHRSNCLKYRPKREALAAPIAREATSEQVRFDPTDPSSLISTTARLVDEALSLLENAKRGDDRKTALAALREARDGLALLMRSAGMLAGDGITIDARQQTLIAAIGDLSDEQLRAAVRRAAALEPASADVA